MHEPADAPAIPAPPLRKSERTTPRRHPERASFDRPLAHAILDEGLVAHVGMVTPGGPIVVPMVYGRHGDALYLHGSVASRLLRGLAEGVPLCVTVTLVDGLVLARSAFYHSANYRSVMLMGVARPVHGVDEQRLAARVLVDHTLPGRAALVRPPSDKELRATALLRLDLDEGSVKVRSGPPGDADEDVADDSPWRAVWAGVVPLSVSAGAPEPEARVAPGAPAPAVPPRRSAAGDRRVAR